MKTAGMNFCWSATRFGLVVLLGAGCATPDVARFARVAEQVSDEAVAAYGRLDESTIERRLAEVAANAPELPTEDTFAPLLLGKDLAVRMSLLRNLRDYAGGLRELDAADHRAQVDRASRKLDRALRALNRNLAASGIAETSVADADLALFAIVVRRLGEAIGEARRRQAIAAAVKLADPVVRRAGELLAEELPQYGDFVEANLAVVESELLAAYRAESAHLSFSARMQCLREIRHQRILRAESKAFFVTVARAAARLAEAHAAQQLALSLGAVDLPALAEAMGELERAELDLRAFRERWATWSKQP